jgi:hypothetical protein
LYFTLFWCGTVTKERIVSVFVRFRAQPFKATGKKVAMFGTA